MTTTMTQEISHPICLPKVGGDRHHRYYSYDCPRCGTNWHATWDSAWALDTDESGYVFFENEQWAGRIDYSRKSDLDRDFCQMVKEHDCR